MSDDFTTLRYAEILKVAKSRYRFLTFVNRHSQGSVALWRHDIDFSPQRALEMARVEADAEVVATYFVQLSSRFYNVFEPEIVTVVRQIGQLGHDIGLHFDPEAGIGGEDEEGDLARRLSFEADVLGHVAHRRVEAFSLHNPTTISSNVLNQPQYGDLINASHHSLREEFSYCSDSNGVWRHRPLESMVADPDVEKLYTLTHPEWWQAEAMPPRDRIQRCIDGRAAFGARYYDDLLSTYHRPNIKA